jgi:hypothetical protein
MKYKLVNGFPCPLQFANLEIRDVFPAHYNKPSSGIPHTKAHGALMCYNINYLYQLTLCTEEELLRLPSVGKKTVEHIKNKLSYYKLKLRNRGDRFLVQ